MLDTPKFVQLMVTCIIDTLYPQIGSAVVEVLERTGITVLFPEAQTCCGQPSFNAGLREQARSLAEHTIDVLEQAPYPVVIPSGSCAAMIRYSYLELFAGDPIWFPRAQKLAERTYELTEFLVDILGITRLGARYPGKLAYHSSCHLLRELGVSHQPRVLLQAIDDAELLELKGSNECCGFGGVFSVEFPEISGAMLQRKLENIEACGADLIVACDAGCLTNINGGLHRRGLPPRAVHIAEVLNRCEP